MPFSDELYLANFHSHTPRCHHASAAEEDLILRAIENRYDCIGFSDHSPWPYASDFTSNMRMPLSMFDDYVNSIHALREKYADRIRVVLGLECEAFPQYYSWLDEMREEKGLDYLILGNHYDTNDETGGFYFGRCREKSHLFRYMETTIGGMETGRFAYLAHPDLCLWSWPSFDEDAKLVCRELCRTAKRLNMPLEFNFLGYNRRERAWENGTLGYTTDHFWEIAAETGCRAILGVDAHSVDELNVVPLYLRIREKLESMGIEVLQVIDGFVK